MASAAIPIFFPPVAIGGSFFGDGCVRMSAPLSPAVHLGADRIVAIGVRYVRAPGEVAAFDYVRSRATPTLSEIGGVLLNAMLLDALEADVERSERINGTLSALDGRAARASPQPLRRIPAARAATVGAAISAGSPRISTGASRACCAICCAASAPTASAAGIC